MMLKRRWVLAKNKPYHNEWKTDDYPAIICCTKHDMKKHDKNFGWKEIR
jgi:hypothetical protein